jgi:hypothetical protein
MEDQTIFDDDGWMTAPLLEPTRSTMYASYRYAYAEMLHMWSQPLARLEIMKFNVLKEDMQNSAMDASFHDSSYSANDATTITSHQPAHNSSPILLGKKEQLQNLITSGRGLDVTGICCKHETQLEPLKYISSTATRLGGAVGTCDRCHKTQSQLRCVYCHEPVDALYPPCLGCGCASHDACLAEWHAMGEVYCPAGDECNCVEEATNGQVESWAAMMAALRKGLTPSKGLISAKLPPPAMGQVNGSDEEVERGDWESVVSSAWIPSRIQGQATGPAGVMSAAKVSLGNRLKKSAGDWSRAGSSLRRGRNGGASWRAKS